MPNALPSPAKWIGSKHMKKTLLIESAVCWHPASSAFAQGITPIMAGGHITGGTTAYTELFPSVARLVSAMSASTRNWARPMPRSTTRAWNRAPIIATCTTPSRTRHDAYHDDHPRRRQLRRTSPFQSLRTEQRYGGYGTAKRTRLRLWRNYGYGGNYGGMSFGFGFWPLKREP